jgi:hypothetical protein
VYERRVSRRTEEKRTREFAELYGADGGEAGDAVVRPRRGLLQVYKNGGEGVTVSPERVRAFEGRSRKRE